MLYSLCTMHSYNSWYFHYWYNKKEPTKEVGSYHGAALTRCIIRQKKCRVKSTIRQFYIATKVIWQTNESGWKCFSVKNSDDSGRRCSFAMTFSYYLRCGVFTKWSVCIVYWKGNGVARLSPKLKFGARDKRLIQYCAKHIKVTDCRSLLLHYGEGGWGMRWNYRHSTARHWDAGFLSFSPCF